MSPMELVTPLEPSPVRGKSAPRERATTTRQAVRLTTWVRLEMAAASARGRRRRVNEDAHSALNGSALLFVVADGVGGGAMAARASRELVHRLHDALDDRRIDAGRIRDAVLRADREVGHSIARHTEGAGAATVALCAGTGMLLSRWLIAWVGDCRVYRVSARGEEPAQLLTVDDTYGHLSEMPPPGGSRDDPARMVGNGAVSSPNVDRIALHGGEMLVLCSDGIHKHVEPRELSNVLRGSAPLVRRCGRLLALARARGSRDDATVLVVRREPRHARVALLVAACVLVAALAGALVLTVAERGVLPPLQEPSAPAIDAAQPVAPVAAPDAQPSSEVREP
jgi:serine/threonine protein phosphatase PrpC